QVHAQREDGVAAMFLIRDVEPRADQPKIFVVELPYPVTDLSGQPDAAGYRRLAAFQEQWLEPACVALGWTFVAWKSEDGSFFLYLYGAGDPDVLLEKLAPFDGELGFFNDLDADWSEYAALRELVEQSEARGNDEEDEGDRDHDDDHHHDHGEGDHDHPDDPDRGHDDGITMPGIRVIDLTGDAPDEPARRAASKPARPATSKPTKRTAPASKPAKRTAPASKPGTRRQATKQRRSR